MSVHETVSFEGITLQEPSAKIPSEQAIIPPVEATPSAVDHIQREQTHQTARVAELTSLEQRVQASTKTMHILIKQFPSSELLHIHLQVG